MVCLHSTDRRRKDFGEEARTTMAVRTGAVMREKSEELLLSRIEVVGMREEDARKGKEERGCKQIFN